MLLDDEEPAGLHRLNNTKFEYGSGFVCTSLNVSDCNLCLSSLGRGSSNIILNYDTDMILTPVDVFITHT